MLLVGANGTGMISRTAHILDFVDAAWFNAAAWIVVVGLPQMLQPMLAGKSTLLQILAGKKLVHTKLHRTLGLDPFQTTPKV